MGEKKKRRRKERRERGEVMVTRVEGGEREKIGGGERRG